MSYRHMLYVPAGNSTASQKGSTAKCERNTQVVRGDVRPTNFVPREIFLCCGVESLLIGSGYRKDTTMLLYGYYTTMRREIIGQWGNDHKEMFLWIAASEIPVAVHGAHLRALSSLNTCYRFFSRS